MGIQSIRTVTIHNNVRSIGIYAFFYCQSLETVTLPTGIEKIDLYTFSQCTALKTITLPASVKIISQYAFAECTSLVSVVVSDDGEGWRYTERPGDTKDIAIDKQTILDPAKFAEMLSSKNKKSYFWKEA